MAEIAANIDQKTIYTFFNYIHSFFFLLIFSILMSVLLVYPTYSYGSICLQLIFLSNWVYWVHRLSHNLPNSLLNYHLYSHHNKALHLPRHIELAFEFFTDLSWFGILLLLNLLLKYICNISFLSNTLILFIGIWYSSVHVLNLSLFNDHVHKYHHKDSNYNYGPPYIDFMFGTLQMDDSYTTNSEITNGLVVFFLLKAIQKIVPFDV